MENRDFSLADVATKDFVEAKFNALRAEIKASEAHMLRWGIATAIAAVMTITALVSAIMILFQGV